MNEYGALIYWVNLWGKETRETSGIWIFVCFDGKRAIDVTDVEAITGWAKAVSDVSVTQNIPQNLTTKRELSIRKWYINRRWFLHHF